MKDKINLIFKCVALGTAIASIVLNILNAIDTEGLITLLSIGLASLAIAQFDDIKKD